ncbi:MAG: type III secretion system cytoplasmic ring protein SctQ [Parachlamydiales bacterium]
MSTETNVPYSWLKSLPPSLFEVDEIPLTGKIQPFPWQRFVEAIIKQFELSKLSLHPKDWKWLDSQELFSGLGEDPHLIKIGLSGYEGKAIFAINKRDLQAAIYLFILHRPLELNAIDSSYEQAFYHLLTIAFCDQFTALDWEKGLQPYILPQSDFTPETMLSMDIDVEAADRHFIVRLFLDNTLRQNWKEKHTIPFEASQNPTLAQKLTLPVSIEAGYFNIRRSQWENLTAGDFVFLDSCTINDNLHDGSLLLRVYDIPYYKAQLSEGNITLDEQPSYNEMESTMPKNDDDDTDFDFDDESEHEETEHDDKTEHEDEDSDFNFDDDSDFDFDDDSEIETHTEHEDTDTENKAAATATAAAPPSPAKAAAPAKPAASASAGKKSEVVQSSAKSGSLKDIPMHVVVEVGRFQMTVEKMMELQPGNMLNLNVSPEDGVDLVVNGRRIGRGELLKFGETLGVRITEVG